jgi:hypothetical protein
VATATANLATQNKAVLNRAAFFIGQNYVFVGFLERVRREGLANSRRKALLCSKSKSNKIENMEIIEKNNSGKLGVLGVVLLAAGFALLGWSLLALPPAPAYGFPWEFALAVAAFLPIAAGGYCLGTLANRRRDPSYRYGSDRHNGGLIPFALLVIIAGVLLLGFNSGVLAGEWKHVFFSLQMLLMVGAMSEYARGRITGASIMLAVGGFFIIRRLAPLYPEIAASGAADSWWPVLLIIAGVLILGSIFVKPSHGGCHNRKHCCGNGTKFGNEGTRASGVIDTEVVFGGSEQVYLDPVFRGGRISTVFGGVKLDLRRTTLPEGDTYLKIESVFGGIEIDTPEEWAIEIRSESIFGGFVDKRLPPVGGGYDDGRKLIIKASCVFGGGEIK